MGLNGELSPGFSVKVMQNTSGEWDWSIVRFRTPVASGHTKTEREALAALKKVVGETVIDATASRQKRSIAKLKLKSWVERRPGLVMFVFRQALAGVGVKGITDDAERVEEELLEEEFKREGGIGTRPAPHAARKPAVDVVRSVCEQIKTLGWKRPQLQKYADAMFGPSFRHPGLTMADLIAMAFDEAKRGTKPREEE